MRMLILMAVAAAGLTSSPALAAGESPGQELEPAHLASNRPALHPQALCRRGYHWGRYCFKPSSIGCLAWSSYRCVRNE
jgi:hypothetical protein